jgi:protein transport protein SEC31
MVRLREIPRTAAFAFSPGAQSPLVVTGTRAGAVDADFSDETKLELWDLSLDDLDQGVELQPIASISTDSRYVHYIMLLRFSSNLHIHQIS